VAQQRPELKHRPAGHLRTSGRELYGPVFGSALFDNAVFDSAVFNGHRGTILSADKTRSPALVPETFFLTITPTTTAVNGAA
jgi:hypothetical protein